MLHKNLINSIIFEDPDVELPTHSVFNPNGGGVDPKHYPEIEKLAGQYGPNSTVGRLWSGIQSQQNAVAAPVAEPEPEPQQAQPWKRPSPFGPPPEQQEVSVYNSNNYPTLPGGRPSPFGPDNPTPPPQTPVAQQAAAAAGAGDQPKLSPLEAARKVYQDKIDNSSNYFAGQFSNPNEQALARQYLDYHAKYTPPTEEERVLKSKGRFWEPDTYYTQDELTKKRFIDQAVASNPYMNPEEVGRFYDTMKNDPESQVHINILKSAQSNIGRLNNIPAEVQNQLDINAQAAQDQQAALAKGQSELKQGQAALAQQQNEFNQKAKDQQAAIDRGNQSTLQRIGADLKTGYNKVSDYLGNKIANIQTNGLGATWNGMSNAEKAGYIGAGIAGLGAAGLGVKNMINRRRQQQPR